MTTDFFEKWIPVEEIYQAYPRKVGRPAAFKAIERVCKRFARSVVLEKTQLFAAVWASATKEDLSYCPHPATWFNQERFNDEPATWRRSGNQNAVYAKLRDKERLLKERVAVLGDKFTFVEDRKADPKGYQELKGLKEQLDAVQKQMLQS